MFLKPDPNHVQRHTRRRCRVPKNRHKSRPKAHTNPNTHAHAHTHERGVWFVQVVIVPSFVRRSEELVPEPVQFSDREVCRLELALRWVGGGGPHEGVQGACVRACVSVRASVRVCRKIDCYWLLCDMSACI